MVPKPISAQLTPLVLDQSAPVNVHCDVRFETAPSAVSIDLLSINTVLNLSPSNAGKTWTGSIPSAAFLTGFDASDVHRKFLGHLKVSQGAETSQSNLFGDVLTPAVPSVAIQSVAADVQFSPNLVNIRFSGLADSFAKILSQLQVEAICQKFFANFADEYDFLNLVFTRSHFENRGHFGTRNDVQGIGSTIFDNTAAFGSAGRLQGITLFPIPTFFDAASPGACHELGHQWLMHLGFAPFASGKPHWPLSDLASDLMGWSVLVDGVPQGSKFDFTLQPVGGGNFQMVPDPSPKNFSDLSLYLMGMVLPGSVGSHFVFDNQNQTVVANGILNGPTTAVTAAGVIAQAGARVPSAANSQKRFRMATILVTKSALATNNEMRLYDFFAERARAKVELAYREGLVKATGRPFRLATKSIGRLDPGIKRRILVDASRDGGAWWFPQTSGFSADAPHQGKALADHLRSLRHHVVELGNGEAITPALLAGFDIVIRPGGAGSYTAAEIAAYDGWVKDFGSLLLLVDHHPNDALSNHYGLQFKGIVRGQSKLSTFVAHPLTQGVGPLDYLGGSGLVAKPAAATVLGSLSGASFLDLNDDNVQNPGEPSAPAGLGILPFGQGRIVFCGDVNLWEKVPQPLVQNTLRHFTAP